MGVERFDLRLGQVFHIDQPIAGAFKRGDDLIELQMDCQRIFVLAALDEEYHQEGNDGRAGIDYQLPRI